MARKPKAELADEPEVDLENDVVPPASEGGDDVIDVTGDADSTPAPSWRDQGKEFGIDLSDAEDDAAAWKRMAEFKTKAEAAEAAKKEADQYKQLAGYGQQYLQNAGEFQAYLQQKQAAAQAPKADPYARPEWNEAWQSLLTEDEGGRIVPNEKLGGTPDMVQKYHEYRKWQRGLIDKPTEYLDGHITKRAEEIAKQYVDSQMTQMREQFAAQQFIATNRDWLYGKDENGRPTGQLSPEGQWFQQDLTEAQSLGMTSQQQEAYAMKLLSIRRQAAPQSAADKKNGFLKNAAGHAAQSGASLRNSLKEDASDQNSNMSLADRFRANFKANGITDDDFAAVN